MARENNKLSWLEEVKADAEYLYKKRLREAEEDRKFEESKHHIAYPSDQAPTTEPEDDKKGKK